MTMSESNWVSGINAVLELLKQNPQSARRVLLKRNREDNRLNTVRNLAKASEIELVELDAGSSIACIRRCIRVLRSNWLERSEVTASGVGRFPGAA